jgi:hypothetical protein
MAEHKSDLVERIRRRLGAPLIKVELTEEQIEDNVDYARTKFIKWAVGQSVVERYGTLLLSAGQAFYDLPVNTTDVLSYDHRATGSIHTLFTVENYLYNAGMYDQMMMRGGASNYSLLSYHIARDFLKTVKRYVVSSYDYKYHKYTNKIEITPTPPSGGTMTFTISGSNVNIDSPGFILLRTMVIEGTEEDMYGGSQWIFDYALSLSKTTLGRIRSKFANFSAVGSNVGLAMDGDTLLQEGIAEIERLEETLRNEEVWDMTGEIMIG